MRCGYSWLIARAFTSVLLAATAIAQETGRGEESAREIGTGKESAPTASAHADLQPPAPETRSDANKPAAESAEKSDSDDAQSAGVPTANSIPDWVHDARWYYIYVPRFANGDKSNDPPGTKPWRTPWLVDRKVELRTDSNLREQAYDRATGDFGGDIAGLRARLSYLKQLGVNAIWLSGVFGVALHGGGEAKCGLHVGDSLSSQKVSASSDSDVGSMISVADAELLAFAKEAHAVGLRVAAEWPYHKRGLCSIESSRESLRTWLDPNGDGDGNDGLDGLFLHSKGSSGAWIQSVGVTRESFVDSESYDTDTMAALFGCRLFNENLESWTTHRSVPDDFVRAAASGTARGISERVNVAASWRCEPFRSDCFRDPIIRDDGRPFGDDRRGADAWRLRTVLAHFFLGEPMTRYGDEVGGQRGEGRWSKPPMWWPDLPNPESKPPDYRGDFFSLIQWLHKMRAEHEPIRRGDFRMVMHDEEKKIFSFARSLPGDEVVVVMNYGDTKQKIMLPCGTPGQMAVTLSPMIDPSTSRRARMQKGGYDHTKIAPLPVGGGRAFINKDGELRLWVDPMSIRVVLVNDEEPRRK